MQDTINLDPEESILNTDFKKLQIIALNAFQFQINQDFYNNANTSLDHFVFVISVLLNEPIREQCYKESLANTYTYI